MSRKSSRRTFIRNTSAIGAAVFVGGSVNLQGMLRSANEKLNVASFGVGGKGWAEVPHPEVQHRAGGGADRARDRVAVLGALGRNIEALEAAAGGVIELASIVHTMRTHRVECMT
jgi:hypothetical protein